MSETKLTERQQKILNLVKESPTITGKQMSETLSVSQRTIERDLSALQKMGILKREGKDNDGMWVFVKNNVNSQFSTLNCHFVLAFRSRPLRRSQLSILN
jgi:predicted HTH transcriptional regulator